MFDQPNLSKSNPSHQENPFAGKSLSGSAPNNMIKNKKAEEPQDIFADTSDGEASQVYPSSGPKPEVLRSKSQTEASTSDVVVSEKTTQKASIFSVKKLLALGLVVILIGGGWFVVQNLDYFKNMVAQVPEEVDEYIPEEIIDSEADVIAEEDIDKLDTDRDGLTDIEELELGLDINNVDTDGDGLSDRDEVNVYKTDPLNPDSDSDGYLDGAEISSGYNPLGKGELLDIPSE